MAPLKKRCYNPENWKRNVKQKSVASGRHKPFKPVTKCCRRKCFEIVSEAMQEDLYAQYDRCKMKAEEDIFLASMMRWSAPKQQKRNAVRPRNITWKYTITCDGGIDVITCKSFYQSLFQVSLKRIVIMQKKIVDDSGFEEKRGKHGQQHRIMTEELRALLHAHLISIPHKKSHYTRSKMLYFEHSDITVKKLYHLFRQFYYKKKKEPLRMTLKHYYKVFQTMNFSVKQPKTDVCDECEKFKIEVRRNPTNIRILLKKRIHLRAVRMHKKRKDELLRNISADTLIVEFDYAQNLPLPKLAINSQFYKRLLWLYNLNIHCHNDNDSTFYTFLETEGKKNASSIVSFLHHFLLRKGVGKTRGRNAIRRVVLLSDNAGGQNKNFTMVRYCAWLSKRFDLEIEHIFPVRGHSFCICDRNFGIYGRRVKKTCPITSVDEYLNIMKECRLKPFNVVHDPSIMLDYDEMFNQSKAFLSKPSSFKIRSCRRLKYMYGVLSAGKTYSRSMEPFQIIRRTFNNDFPPIPLKKVTLAPQKATDLRKLLVYVRNEEHANFFRQLCDGAA